MKHTRSLLVLLAIIAVLVSQSLAPAPSVAQGPDETPTPLPPTGGQLPAALSGIREQNIEKIKAYRAQDALMPAVPSPYYSHSTIPTTIRVAITGNPNCGSPIQRVDVVDFKTYVKNVLPAEWPASWNMNSLKAGAIAVKTYAWQRMNARGSWSYDVQDNTCDQVYTPGSAQSTTNTAVDETWNEVLRLNGQIIEVNYTSTDDLCNSLGWPRCMGQWGSKYWADLGYDYKWILHHYYDPISIDNLAPPANTNLLSNADFSNTTHIRPWAFLPDGNNCAWAIYGYPNGTLSTHRPGQTNCASLFQDVTVNASAGQTVTLSMWGIRAWDGPAREGRLVLWPWGASQSQVETRFSLGPSWTCHWVSMNINTGATGFRAEVYLDSIGHPDYTFDNFSLVVGTKGCPPGMPTIQSPAAGATVGKTFNVVLQAGAANATGKMDWRVQVDNNADFSSPVFDSSSTSTTIPVTVPSNGIYWVRARQGDGVDMSSDMTAPVQFTVGNSPDTIGVFRNGNHIFYLRASNSAGNPTFAANFGLTNDLPIVGDWNGDGIASPGVFRNGRFYLTNKVSGVMTIDYNFAFGVVGDIPVAGDWNGDGRDEVGVYRPSLRRFYFRNSLTSGAPDNVINFGLAGDIPIVGDWNGDRKDTIGVWRPSSQTFYLSNAGCFNCSATVNTSFRYGLLNDVPFVGDWDGNGTSGVGVFRPSTGMMYLRNPLSAGAPNLSFRYGLNGDKPVAGRWTASGDEAPIFVPKQ